MHELAPLVYDLAIMLGLASIVVLLFQRIHQPVVLGYLVAGMIVGPNTPPHALVSDIQNIQVLSELGVIFLMFSLGLEFSFQKLARVGFSASLTGTIEVILMIIIGYGVGRLLGWTNDDALFLGAALSISSTTIIIKAIDDLKLKTKHFAEIIFGVLIVEDLLAILLLVALSAMVITKNIFSTDMLMAVIQLILVVGGWFIIGYFLVPSLFVKIAKYISQETLTIISVALCLFLVCVAVNFHYSTALGAFIMGSILAETVLVRRIEELIRPICSIFAAVFFISIGMLIDPVIIINHWAVVLLLALVTIAGKLITTSLAAFLTGQSLSTAVRVGFSMAQVGELSFIIAALGAALGVTSNKLYPLIVAVSGITTFTTPYLIQLSGKIAKMLEHTLPGRIQFFLTTSKAHSFFSAMTMRIFINGILVAIIFILVNYFFLKKWDVLAEKSGISHTIFLFTSLMISSPFIWGMLFSYKKNNTRAALVPTVFLIWLITFVEIAILSVLFSQSLFTLLLIFVLAAIFFFVFYPYLERSYYWFERQFMSNLKNKTIENSHELESFLDNFTLQSMLLSENHPCIGQSICDTKIQESIKGLIVGLERNNQRILNPDPNMILQANDLLLIVGEVDKIRELS